MRTRRTGERAAWGLLSVVVAGWLALVEVFWLPLRVAGLLVPLSVAAAVAANLVLPGLAYRVSGSRLVAVLPAITWLGVVVPAMIRRPEGDLIITGGGATGVVNLAFLMLGVLAAAFSVGRVVGGPRTPVRRAEDPPETDAAPAPGRAGSGTGGAR
jgi:hypothetical protein